MKKNVEGAFGVLLTPFKGNKVDEEAFVAQVKRLQNKNIAGYVVNGSTSEFVQLSIEEQKRVATLVAENGDKDKKIIVSACTGNLADTYEICCHAKKIGAFACLCCPPYYFKYTAKEREEYFTRLGDISPVPIILYNIPFFTQEIELSVIFNLMGHKNIYGIKDSSANMKRLQHLVQKADGTPFSVMTGTDDILVPALVGGCTGSMTAGANIYPDKISALYDAVKAGDIKKGLEIEFEMLPAIREADSETFPIGYKKLLEKESGIKFPDKEVVL